MNNNKTLVYDNLKQIPKKSKALIIDIWGVLWDGLEAYEEAKNCLKSLKNQNNIIILLSNAPRKVETVISHLNNIGITNDLYDYILSSGEFCRQAFMKRSHLIASLGKNYFFLGLENDKGLIDDLSCKQTKLEDADFILLCGARNLKHTIEDYHTELKSFLDYKLPMICVNPDKIVVRKNGEKLICAGKLASYYASIGGKVISFGKPFKEIFDECLILLKKADPTIDKKDVMVIGDSLETDIRGAKNAEISSVFIAGGIHNDFLEISNYNKPPSINKLNQLFDHYKIKPDYTITKFS